MTYDIMSQDVLECIHAFENLKILEIYSKHV
nr:MAG TPA: hypothetical protein [Caudoviricetes sp.]